MCGLQSGNPQLRRKAQAVNRNMERNNDVFGFINSIKQTVPRGVYGLKSSGRGPVPLALPTLTPAPPPLAPRDVRELLSLLRNINPLLIGRQNLAAFVAFLLRLYIERKLVNNRCKKYGSR